MPTEDIIKSNFMFADPNKGKYNMIAQTQSAYLKSINKFIGLMMPNTSCYLSIFELKTQSKVITNIEKLNRDSFLGSAYSQKASHTALDKLHGTFEKIKRDLYGYAKNNNKALLPFVSFNTLLNACLTGKDTTIAMKEAIICEYENMIRKHEKTIAAYMGKYSEESVLKIQDKSKKLITYQKVYADLVNMDILTRKHLEKEASTLFLEKLDYVKTPEVTFSPIPLDSRTCAVVATEELKDFDYILKVTVAKGIDTKGKIVIPFKTSKHCLLRMDKYKKCQPSICIDKTGKVKLSLPIIKKVVKPTVDNKTIIVGTDLGIIKIFALNNNINFGTFRGKTSEYNELVEKQLGNRSKLRNVMRAYQKELKSKNTSDAKKEILRIKIFNIAKNLQGHKRLTKSRNRYKFGANVSISMALKGFLRYLIPIKSKVLVVLEQLNIKDFNWGKTSNKRNSMWARGQIIDKLSRMLKWHGIAFDFVDPAYTSQQCPICNNVSKLNRKGEIFKCICCGHIADADNNAAVNIGNRFNDTEIASVVCEFSWDTKKRHSAIKTICNSRNHYYKIVNNVA